MPASHEPTPIFIAEPSNNPRFNFNTVVGRYVLLTFYGPTSDPGMHKVLVYAAKPEDIFDDLQACFFGVSIDTDDKDLERVSPKTVGYRFFWGFSQEISKLYGAIEGEPSADGSVNFRPVSVLIDPVMRMMGHEPIDNPETHIEQLTGYLRKLPKISQPFGA